jgi:hypothetical protein
VNYLLLRLNAAGLSERVVGIGQHEEPVQNRDREPNSEGHDDDDGSEDQQEIPLAMIVYYHPPNRNPNQRKSGFMRSEET